MATSIVNTMESTSWLDTVADPVQRTIAGALDKAPAVADALHGKWLGHSLHAALTDLPIGAWAAGMVLDVLSTSGRGARGLRRGADAVHTFGLVTALGAAAAGLADWSRYAQSSGKRLGFVHGAANVVIAGLFGGSLLARSKGARATGIALAGVGLGLVAISSWLGGELTYRLGIHVGASSEAEQPDRGLPAYGTAAVS